MYVHKKCALSAMVLESERRASGFCAVCGQMGAIYHVNGTVDYYEAEVNGVVLRHGEREESESIPYEEFVMKEHPELREVYDDEMGEVGESIAVLDRREDLPMGVIVEDAEVPLDSKSDPIVPVEIPTVTLAGEEEENITATLEDQIAALRAKIDTLEAEKE